MSTGHTLWGVHSGFVVGTVWNRSVEGQGETLAIETGQSGAETNYS